MENTVDKGGLLLAAGVCSHEKPVCAIEAGGGGGGEGFEDLPEKRISLRASPGSPPIEPRHDKKFRRANPLLSPLLRSCLFRRIFLLAQLRPIRVAQAR